MSCDKEALGALKAIAEEAKGMLNDFPEVVGIFQIASTTVAELEKSKRTENSKCWCLACEHFQSYMDLTDLRVVNVCCLATDCVHNTAHRSRGEGIARCDYKHIDISPDGRCKSYESKAKPLGFCCRCAYFHNLKQMKGYCLHRGDIMNTMYWCNKYKLKEKSNTCLTCNHFSPYPPFRRRETGKIEGFCSKEAITIDSTCTCAAYKPCSQKER